MKREELKEKARNLPLCPGVYLMMDRTGKVIYVGKAKVLKNRVSQYFQEGDRGAKTEAMVQQVSDFDVIIVGSEFDALVLECALIKRHMPKYNILLKDDKGYPYIRLSQREDYPRFSLVSRPSEDGARYFGPYGGRSETRTVIDALCKALKLPVCSRKFPRDIGRERPCLHYQIGNCDGWCREGLDAGVYREGISRAVLLLEGKSSQVERELLGEMEQASEELRFERAAELRDRYQTISLLSKRQQLVAGGMADTDAVGLCLEGEKSAFAVLHYIGGELLDKDTRLFSIPLEEDAAAVISSVLYQYYEGRGRLPRQILLPCSLEDQEDFTRMLAQQAGHSVYVTVPQRGEKAEQVRLAGENAAQRLRQAATKEERENRLLEALQKLLSLENLPRRIEAYDVSNTGGADIVASMTVFVEGRPLKRDYRQFKIKEQDAQDDYHAMGEALRRRLRRYAEGDERFSVLPDLILIDGGHSHVNVAKRELAAMGLSVPAFGMVKDDRHRTRALIDPDGREIGLSANQSLFALIGRIQEETHRFAITFHRTLRSKSSRSSALDQIPGVGPARKSALFRHFKSMKAMREADLSELEAVLPKSAAAAVYAYFHGEPDTKKE